MASTIYRLYSYSWDNVPTGEAPTGKDLTSGKLSGSDTYRTCFVVLQAVCQSIFPWCLGANICCWWTSKMLAEYAVHWADERKGIGLIVYEVMAQNLSIPQKNKIRMICSFLFPWFSMDWNKVFHWFGHWDIKTGHGNGGKKRKNGETTNHGPPAGAPISWRMISETKALEERQNYASLVASKVHDHWGMA